MLEFKRVKQQNFYVAQPYHDVKVLKSYNTIVGVIINNHWVYQVKYSRTTSKQVTQYINQNLTSYYNNVVDAEMLHDIILNNAGLDIDTRYNCG